MAALPSPKPTPPERQKEEFFLNASIRERLTTYRGLAPMAPIFARTNYRAALVYSRHYLAGPCWEDAIDHAQNWGRELIELLNVEVEVRGEIPDTTCLYIANHRSYIDIPLLLSLVRTTFLAKKEVRDYPAVGTGAEIIQCVFVDRKDKASRRASRDAIRATLERGLSLLVFPEGTSYPGPDLLRFHKGSFHLAAEGLFPVVPIAIEYDGPSSCWNGDMESLKRFGQRRCEGPVRVVVNFGAPTLCSDPERLWRATEDWIRGNLIRPGKVPIPR